jgi:predicted aconitase with swiveling domain
VTRISGPASSPRILVAGAGSGEALVLDEPLSFWGGVDPSDGRIIDRHHPQAGQSVRGKVLVMPSGRGSSSSSSVLAETLRAGTGPAAIVLAEPDPIVALGAVVARELYGSSIPVIVVDREAYAEITPGRVVRIGSDGRIGAGGQGLTP